MRFKIFQFEIIQKKGGAFDLENKGFQKILFPKLAWISTCFSKVLQLTLPHHSNRISKIACLKNFWEKPQYLQNIFIKMIFKLHVPAIPKHLFQKFQFGKKFIN
jgi:hypothetical protein